jgi:hypothetical protein
MEFIEFLLRPATVMGCILGLLVAGILQWLFPSENLLFGQALIVATGFVLGVAIDYRFDDSRD